MDRVSVSRKPKILWSRNRSHATSSQVLFIIFSVHTAPPLSSLLCCVSDGPFFERSHAPKESRHDKCIPNCFCSVYIIAKGGCDLTRFFTSSRSVCILVSTFIFKNFMSLYYNSASLPSSCCSVRVCHGFGKYDCMPTKQVVCFCDSIRRIIIIIIIIIITTTPLAVRIQHYRPPSIVGKRLAFASKQSLFYSTTTLAFHGTAWPRCHITQQRRRNTTLLDLEAQLGNENRLIVTASEECQ